jgi:carbon-monoxide dehydrogenase small subunit
MKSIRFSVNGKQYELTVPPHRTLLEVIREELGLTGTKEGCGVGECGACTVIMGGKAVNSCLVLAAEADGKEITTIEGLAQGDKLHPLQQAFIDHGGFQCGFCTPGMIMSAKALLEANPRPSEAEIRKGISGNFCRCTGYTKIIESIKAAAEDMEVKP